MLRPGFMVANSSTCPGQAWLTVYCEGHFGWIQKPIPCPLRDWQMSSRNAFAEDVESIRKQRAIWISLRMVHSFSGQILSVNKPVIISGQIGIGIFCKLDAAGVFCVPL